MFRNVFDLTKYVKSNDISKPGKRMQQLRLNTCSKSWQMAFAFLFWQSPNHYLNSKAFPLFGNHISIKDTVTHFSQ